MSDRPGRPLLMRRNEFNVVLCKPVPLTGLDAESFPKPGGQRGVRTASSVCGKGRPSP
jgi:hypothetical protein